VAVERLVTTVTPAFGRVAIHGTRIDVLEAQAAAADLDLMTTHLPFPCSNAEYEAAVAPVIDEAARSGVQAMAFGDLFLADVRRYREDLLEGSGIKPLFPLWGSDTSALADEMVQGGLEARIVSLDPERLDPAWAGALWNRDFLARRPDTIDPCGENGELHTCVTAGPMLRRPLVVSAGEVVTRDGFVYADLTLEPTREGK
jgi:diphthamide synthase (EF-2-diphthine--ammonia ligase)